MKLMRHRYLITYVTLITCVSLGQVSIGQANEYARDYSMSDRHSRSQDNIWRSGTTFNNIRRVRYEPEGTTDNPWRANNYSGFERPRFNESGRNNQRKDNGYYYERGGCGERSSRSYDHRYRNINTLYGGAYNPPWYPYDAMDSLHVNQLDPVYGSPLIDSSLPPGVPYGAYPYRSYPYGFYPYSGMGGFRPW